MPGEMRVWKTSEVIYRISGLCFVTLGRPFYWETLPRVTTTESAYRYWTAELDLLARGIPPPPPRLPLPQASEILFPILHSTRNQLTAAACTPNAWGDDVYTLTTACQRLAINHQTWSEILVHGEHWTGLPPPATYICRLESMKVSKFSYVNSYQWTYFFLVILFWTDLMSLLFLHYIRHYIY